MTTLANFEVRIERKELGAFAYIKNMTADRSVGNNAGEDYDYSSEWEYFFDKDFPDVFAKTLVMGDALPDEEYKWSYATIETRTNSDYEPDGYLVVFCVEMIKNDIVLFDAEINNDGELLRFNFKDGE